ncbi:MAG: bifunctional phosphopantothenoylcysteine decarboxylase/phosphopantothenate--cysteine ligase CoaBC [Proteobacteria bacterium]|nr:bifunctional phosphopantothenoylcysteine decarboxylase/phosphopantothenate--cysteine ligase CoaBC [Pseudomonadota bacterium]
MPFPAGQHILLGITGGVAAYKSADLVRRLSSQGAEIQVVMTEAAKAFISPLTLQALSGRPVRDTLLDTEAESGMGHIDLGRWADTLLVAPASADFIAKLAGGLASDLLTTVCLATAAPVVIAPAMNQAMWLKPATQRNIQTLAADGVHLIGPDSGEQACGDIGPGRMLETWDIISELESLNVKKSLAGIKVTVTAGPTWEALDPVRGLSNHSSGKMGYAVAEAALKAGAEVNLISGPTTLSPPRDVVLHHVRSADEMLNAVKRVTTDCDIFIGVAAVADYRPSQIEMSKIKKDAKHVTLELIRNPDILSWVTSQETKPFTVGFAAETDNPLEHARQKLEKKSLDIIAVNHVSADHSPFGSDENQLVVITPDEDIDLGRHPKTRLASTLIDTISKKFHESYKT